MPSPFPGMDPFLETQEWRRIFMRKSTPTISDALSSRVAPHYVVRVERRVYVEYAGEDVTSMGRPDVAVLWTGEAAGGTALAAAPAERSNRSTACCRCRNSAESRTWSSGCRRPWRSSRSWKPCRPATSVSAATAGANTCRSARPCCRARPTLSNSICCAAGNGCRRRPRCRRAITTRWSAVAAATPGGRLCVDAPRPSADDPRATQGRRRRRSAGPSGRLRHRVRPRPLRSVGTLRRRVAAAAKRRRCPLGPRTARCGQTALTRVARRRV